jgi:hypothetical protein
LISGQPDFLELLFQPLLAELVELDFAREVGADDLGSI